MPPRTQHVARVITTTIPSHGGVLDVIIDDVFVVFVDLDDVATPSRSMLRRVMNGCASLCVSGYSHAEITFLVKVHSGRRQGELIYLAFAVTSGESLHMEVRTYGRGYHQMARLGISRAAAERLYDACVETIGRPFNAHGFWRNFVVPHALRYDAKGTAYFCSEHVMHMLRQTRVVDFAAFGREPYETTPQQLCAYLSSIGAFNGVRANVHVSADDLLR